MKPRMTRLEAIREWGKASREGKPIPLEAKTVLLLTQNETVYDFSPKSNVSEAQVKPNKKSPKATKLKVKKSTQADITTINSKSIGGAITAEEMEAYNTKRKGARVTTRYSEILNKLLATGMKRSKAQKQASQQYKAEMLTASPPAKVHSKGKPAKNTFSLVQKRKPVAVLKPKVESLNTSWIKNINRTPEELRALAAGKVYVKPEEPEVKKAVGIESGLTSSSVPVVEKIEETFSQKWNRLFKEKGVSAALIAACRNEGKAKGENAQAVISQYITVKNPHPITNTNTLPDQAIREPVSPVETIETPTLPIAIVENFEERVVTPTTPKMNVTPLVIDNARGEKIEINTIGRDSTDQAIFRKAVSANYYHRCSLTGDLVAIEAAHIQTHSNFYDNSVENGIMLSVGLHRLFDKGIMIIDPDTLTVHFTIDCFYKKHLEGEKITEGRIKISREKLIAKNKLFSITVSYN